MARNKTPLPCSIDGCDKPSRALTWCTMHVTRYYRHGDANAPVRVKRPAGLSLKTAFEFGSPIEQNENGCWIWPYGTTKDGYATLYAEGLTHYAHRAAYSLYVGELPADREVDHRCRIRNCVNPAHLRLATRKQNLENCGARCDSGTGVRGVRKLPSGRYQARVTHNQVVAFQRNFETLEEAEAAAIAARNRYFTHNTADRVLDHEMAA